MENTKNAGKIFELLLETTHYLSEWLNKELPLLDKNWWTSLVLTKLSYQQSQRAERQQITSLEKLDLSALLRIFDQNWYQLSRNCGLANMDRNYLKEMQSIRNRWAHTDRQGVNTDDEYRDLDTLQRFLVIIGASPTIIDELKELKISVITSNKPNQALEEVQQDTSNGSIFKEGGKVSLKSDPSKIGVVMKLEGSSPDSRSIVFIDGKEQPLYLSQIQVVDQEEGLKTVSLKELHSILTAMQINHPSLSTLYSLNAARIDFVPYQFRPALKLINSDQPRLLIADGVGVGKTIEAGLVLRELQARHNTESVLIICPKPLVTERKWELEMRRFDERFVALDGKDFQYCIEETDLEGEWPDAQKKAIIPYSLFDKTRLYGLNKGRKMKGLLDLDPAPHFDLVIVDEAHHLRNSNTFSHQAVRFFCDNAEAVVFLTATPIQLGNQDLFTLLNMLRPDLVIDRDSFAHMTEPNVHINESIKYFRAGEDNWATEALNALNRAADTAWGNSILRNNPKFQSICKQLSVNQITREERVKFLREVEGFHSFSRLINRTRRRDIEDFCIRKPITVEVPFTSKQEALHQELLNFEAHSLSVIHGNQNVKFMMSTIRRQAASCIAGLAPLMSDILNRRLSELQWLESGEDDFLPEPEIFDRLRVEAQKIIEFSKSLPDEDPKFDALWVILSEKIEMENNKVIVFSTFRHTLAYLEKNLRGKNVRIGLIHGGIADEDRVLLKKRFELPKGDSQAIDVMLFSEVGCEGLDYQFCDTMINYDLPWNPMRIEQRIGRIDRRGQKSEVVSIYNLVTPGTVDADIYTRCLIRIGIFEESIGECEEILGEVHQEIKSIAENLEMSDTERQKKLEQLADNEIRKIQEQRDLEDRERELFGVRIPKLYEDSELQEFESYWLTPPSIRRFVSEYLKMRLGDQEYILGDKPLKTLRLSREGRNRLLEDFRTIKVTKTPMHREWEKWLKGNEQHCNITFESSCAADQRDALFIMPLHPLVLQSAKVLNAIEPIYTALKVLDTDIESGVYPFVIYAWEHRGVHSELKLIPICEDDSIRKNIFEYLESGAEITANDVLPEQTVFQELDKTHQKIWDSENVIFRSETKGTVTFQKESLEISYQGRINVVQEQILDTTNEKIKKMKEAQLDNMRAEYDRKCKELIAAEESADIYARPIVFGALVVEG
jgi:ATP-dependent helicase HepA